jgi:hypothetical protein
MITSVSNDAISQAVKQRNTFLQDLQTANGKVGESSCDLRLWPYKRGLTNNDGNKMWPLTCFSPHLNAPAFGILLALALEPECRNRRPSTGQRNPGMPFLPSRDLRRGPKLGPLEVARLRPPGLLTRFPSDRAAFETRPPPPAPDLVRRTPDLAHRRVKGRQRRRTCQYQAWLTRHARPLVIFQLPFPDRLC